jgi:predicted transport protein
MQLFELGENGKIQRILEQNFKLEKDIQNLTEKNLSTVFDLQFVKSEFSLNNFRIDTLAFDSKAKAFVAIEYKRDKNFSVIDQGYAYLSLMLNNKADFILEFNENGNQTLKKSDIEWSQSKVIFVSPFFTNYQREAINFKDLPIELWEVKKYSNASVLFNQIKTVGSQESIKTISKQDKAIVKVNQEIKVYTEKEHLEKSDDEIKELYERVKDAVQNLGELEIKPKKLYIAFTAKTNVIDIHLQKQNLRIWINLKKNELDDPKKIAKDVSQTGHWGNGDYQLDLKNDEELEYILSLIKQSLKKNKK